MADMMEKTVVMGIRPENVTDELQLSRKAPVEAKINVYELLGAEVFLYFDVEGFNHDSPCRSSYNIQNW